MIPKVGFIQAMNHFWWFSLSIFVNQIVVGESSRFKNIYIRDLDSARQLSSERCTVVYRLSNRDLDATRLFGKRSHEEVSGKRRSGSCVAQVRGVLTSNRVTFDTKHARTTNVLSVTCARNDAKHRSTDCARVCSEKCLNFCTYSGTCSFLFISQYFFFQFKFFHRQNFITFNDNFAEFVCLRIDAVKEVALKFVTSYVRSKKKKKSSDKNTRSMLRWK